MRIIVFIITAAIQLGVAAITFFMLLLGLNGFSESESTPGLIFFIALGFISVVGLGGASAFAARWLVEKKSFGNFGAAAASIVGFSILGTVVLFAGFLVAVLLATFLREWR